MQWILHLNPQTLEIKNRLSSKCITCKEWLPIEVFYNTVRDNITTKCCRCYDRDWMIKNDAIKHQPIKVFIEKAVHRANRRSRYRRSIGADITVEEAILLWKKQHGTCSHCNCKLTFEWYPRKENKNTAILDRIDTSRNKSYKDNASFKCNWCNTEKGAWDLLYQKNEEIRRLRKKIKKQKQKGIMYESILMH